MNKKWDLSSYITVLAGVKKSVGMFGVEFSANVKLKKVYHVP